MWGEKEVRRRTTPISSAMETKRLRKMSSSRERGSGMAQDDVAGRVGGGIPAGGSVGTGEGFRGGRSGQVDGFGYGGGAKAGGYGFHFPLWVVVPVEAA